MADACMNLVERNKNLVIQKTNSSVFFKYYKVLLVYLHMFTTVVTNLES
jgi:hypothetical protein